MASCDPNMKSFTNREVNDIVIRLEARITELEGDLALWKTKAIDLLAGDISGVGPISMDQARQEAAQALEDEMEDKL